MPEYKAWWIIRDGGFSSQEALQDVFKLTKIDDYETKPSFLMFETKFTNKKKAREHNERLTKMLWDFEWYRKADCSVCGVQTKEDGKWIDEV